MAHIMTKRGTQDNVVTYEHYCDTAADLNDIPSEYTTLGSTAIVVDDNGALGAYMANNNGEWNSILNTSGGGGGGSTTQVQADWACNDPDDPAYVKNRIAYSTNNDTTYFTTTASPSFDQYWQAYMALLNVDFSTSDINLDAIYTLTVNNLSYTGKWVVQNNQYKIGGVSGDFSPSNIGLGQAGQSWYLFINSNTFDNYDNLEVILSGGQVIYELDQKYIPDIEWSKITSTPISTGTGENSIILGTSLNSAASGYASIAQTGNYATASYSSAFGSHCHADADFAHAEGTYTTAGGQSSHAEGSNTVAYHRSQHVFGEYNQPEPSGTGTQRGVYIEIVGNGTTEIKRSNARTLDWSGNEVLAGNLTANGGTITIGSTSITESQLQQLLALLS